MVKTDLGINPFILTPGEYWANREDLWKRIADYIELARHTRSNEIIVLVGDYGCGTTHTLKYLKKYLTEKGAVASYVSIPVEATLRDIYSEFVKGIDEDKRSRIVSKLMDDLAIKEAPEKGLNIEEIEPFFKRLVTTGSERALSLRERDFLRKAGILDRIPSYRELWLYVISNLSTAEWPVFILIDEFDIASMGYISMTLLNGIRRVYDDSLYGLCLVIGLKGEPKDVRKILGEALFSRMSLQPIPLYLISKEEGTEFLRAVLSRKRAKAESPFFPFTEKAIQALIDFSCPTTPRRLLRISSLIFEEACMEKLRVIDDKFVSRIAAKYGEISVSVQFPTTGVPIKEKEAVAGTEPILEGIIEYGTDGIPKILFAPEKLTAKEVIGLLLYARKPSTVGLRELTNLVSRNWRSVNVAYVSANLSQIRQYIIMEGKKGAYSYRLSGAGLSWIENALIPRLKA